MKGERLLHAHTLAAGGALRVLNARRPHYRRSTRGITDVLNLFHGPERHSLGAILISMNRFNVIFIRILSVYRNVTASELTIEQIYR